MTYYMTYYIYTVHVYTCTCTMYTYIYTLQQYCYYIWTLTISVEFGSAWFSNRNSTTLVNLFTDATISGVNWYYVRRVDDNVYY